SSSVTTTSAELAPSRLSISRRREGRAAKPSTMHRVRQVVTGRTKPFDGLSVNPIHARRNFRAHLLNRNPNLSLTLTGRLRLRLRTHRSEFPNAEALFHLRDPRLELRLRTDALAQR